MKKIISLIFASCLPLLGLSQTNVNGVYVQNGKTIEIDTKSSHAYSVNTSNTPIALYFSNGLATEVDTNSEFSIDEFVQGIYNTNSYPEKVKAGESSLTVSLNNGISYFVYPEENTNAECIVSTPLVDVQLHKGSFYIVVTENNILVITVDGSCDVGSKKDKKQITTGNALLAIPNNIGILDSKISLNPQKMKPEVLNKLSTTIKQLSNIQNHVIFVRIDGKIIGVSL